MEKSVSESLEVLLNKIAEDIGLYVVTITFLSLRNNSIEVLIDRIDENRVSISDCKLYSSKIKEYDADLIKILGDEYYFDISSPGIERPLIKLADYERFKGNIIIVRFKEKMENKKKVQGKLVGLENEKIKLEISDGEFIFIDYTNIKNSNIVMTEEIFRQLLSK